MMARRPEPITHRLLFVDESGQKAKSTPHQRALVLAGLEVVEDDIPAIEDHMARVYKAFFPNWKAGCSEVKGADLCNPHRHPGRLTENAKAALVFALLNLPTAPDSQYHAVAIDLAAATLAGIRSHRWSPGPVWAQHDDDLTAHPYVFALYELLSSFNARLYPQVRMGVDESDVPGSNQWAADRGTVVWDHAPDVARRVEQAYTRLMGQREEVFRGMELTFTLLSDSMAPAVDMEAHSERRLLLQLADLVAALCRAHHEGTLSPPMARVYSFLYHRLSLSMNCAGFPNWRATPEGYDAQDSLLRFLGSYTPDGFYTPWSPR